MSENPDIKIVERALEDEQAIESGIHLAAVRNWIKWNCPNGDQVTWGSNDSIGEMTVVQLEEVAQRVYEAMKDECDQLREALCHYADKKNWLRMCEDYHKGSYTLTEWNSTIRGAWEGPNIAKAALEPKVSEKTTGDTEES